MQTIPRDLTDEERRVEAAVGFTHHQVVQPELLLPLETFKDSKHLTSVMYDIAKGAFPHIVRSSLGAYLVTALEHIHSTGTLHRNVGVPNIMIDAGGNGRLIDFELAQCQSGEGAGRSMRTVSFLSVRC